MEELFDSTDLSETHDFLNRAYTTMQIAGHGPTTQTRIRRNWLKTVSFDDVAFSYALDYRAAPLDRVCICRVRSGSIFQRFAGIDDVLESGDIALPSWPDTPFSGRVSMATYEVTMFDTEHLNRVASSNSGATARVRLDSHRPVDARAARQLSATLDYLRKDVLVDPTSRESELVAATAASHLAGVVLATFPNNADTESTTTDRNDATPEALRRAVAFIDDNAQIDIAVSDIGKHVHMTPRGVQYLFRRHLDCTPLEYLRRVRLDHAHHDLTAANRDTSSVASIAAQWGFAHPGRFAFRYRQAYGKTPRQTLEE